jgi:CHAT domain-containing protein/tetratricopeptide (TPR) repeat protein
MNPLGLLLVLIWGAQVESAQPPPPPTPARQQPQEQNSLADQVQELRRAGKLEEAVPVAERALELVRRAFGEEDVRVADALSRLAELHELLGDWEKALTRRSQAWAVRAHVDGKDHWRTVDARLELSLNEKALRLPMPDRRKLIAALAQEWEARDLFSKQQFEQAERVASKASDVFAGLLGADARVGRIFQMLGLLRTIQNDAAGALKAFDVSLEVNRKVLPPGHPNLGWTNYYIGRNRYTLGDRPGATKALVEALNSWARDLDVLDPSVSNHLMIAGKLLRELGDFVSAKQAYGMAVAIHRKLAPADDVELAESLNELGNVQFELGEVESSKKIHEEALSIRRRVLPKDDPEIGRTLSNLGNVQHWLGDLAAAKKSHEAGLAIRRVALPANHPEIAQSLYNLGVVLGDQRNFTQAKAVYLEALAICQESLPKNDLFTSSVLSNLGGVHVELHDLPRARQYFGGALSITWKALPKNHPKVISAIYNLGNLEFQMRNYPSARKLYEAGLQARRDSKPANLEEVADGLNKLGNAEFELRDYQAASASYQEALSICRALPKPDQLDVALYLMNLGLAKGRLWNYEAAKKCFEEALAIRRKALSPDSLLIVATLAELGSALTMLDDYTGAKKSLEEALAICLKSLPSDHLYIAHSRKSLGLLQLELADFAAARKNFEAALIILRKKLPASHPDIASCLACAGWATLRAGGDSRMAGSALMEATDSLLAESVRLSSGQAESEQLQTTEGFHLTFMYLIEAAIEGGVDPAAVYDRALRVKGSVTAHQFAIRLARESNEKKVVDLLEQLRIWNMLLLLQAEVEAETVPQNASTRILALNRRGLGQADTRNTIERQLALLSRPYQEQMERESGGGDGIRSRLPERTALIDLFEYRSIRPAMPGHDEPTVQPWVAAFIIRRDRKGIGLVPLGRVIDLARLADRWRSSYGSGKRPPAGEPDPALELRARVWEPIEKELGDAKTVLISPDGPFHGVPFSAIPGRTRGTYLLEEYRFVVLPVPQSLNDLLSPVNPKFRKPPSLLTVGEVDYNADPPQKKEDIPSPNASLPHFGDLPNTGPEVRRIREVFQRRFPRAVPVDLSKNNATVEAFFTQSSRHPYLHLATHGYFADERVGSGRGISTRSTDSRRPFVFDSRVLDIHPGLASGLVFAGANHNPLTVTALTALDASELDLRGVDLITLSACDTARGAMMVGQGVLGLQRSLQVAGAKTVVASLWSVQDESTALIMAEFYRNLWERNLPKGEALRQAQLKMLRGELRPRGSEPGDGRGLRRPAPAASYSEPYYWAAFVLSGDWR